MKVCSKCTISKPLSMYFTKDSKTGRLHAQCKECYAEHRRSYSSEHYRKYGDAYRERAKKYRLKIRTEFRNGMLAYLADKQCVVCDESDIRTFELDHIHPTEKLFNVSQSVRLGKNWSEVLDELKKCQVLCANCHKKRTAEQFNWYKQ